MNQKGLEAFRAFMENGTITEAARALRRTQPQVSRLLVALEAEVGFPIFTRKNRRLIATVEGRELYASVERALYGLDEVGNAALKIRDRQSQHVRILTAPYVTNALLAEAIATLTQEYPGFTASIDARSRQDIELWIGRENFDLGISVLPLNNDAFDITPMASVRAVAVMREDHPLAAQDVVKLSDLFDLPLVGNSPRTVLRQRMEALFREAGVKPNIRLETPNGVVACDLAARGLGVTVADGFVALSSKRPGMAIRRFEPTIMLDYVFLFPKSQPDLRVIRRLAALVRDAARTAAADDPTR
ncbi:MAG: LysR family transcriptional regulator [Paracoccaceae bacterium]